MTGMHAKLTKIEDVLYFKLGRTQKIYVGTF